MRVNSKNHLISSEMKKADGLIFSSVEWKHIVRVLLCFFIFCLY